MSGAKWTEAETENVAIVRAVTDEERAVRLVRQLRLGLVEPERTPVPPTLPHAHQTLFMLSLLLATVQATTLLDRFHLHN